eukprot:3653570-Pleurochrysis_carterae.AAC.1
MAQLVPRVAVMLFLDVRRSYEGKFRSSSSVGISESTTARAGWISPARRVARTSGNLFRRQQVGVP